MTNPRVSRILLSEWFGFSLAVLMIACLAIGVHDDRPYMLWLPDSPSPWPGMVILHGAGSRKENHGDFGRACAASGWAAVSFDQRGHGESRDAMSPAALGDVTAMARFLAGQDGVDGARVCVRGSSMGGFMAILAAASSDSIAGAIAICPASSDGLTRGLRARRPARRTACPDPRMSAPADAPVRKSAPTISVKTPRIVVPVVPRRSPNNEPSTRPR